MRKVGRGCRCSSSFNPRFHRSAHDGDACFRPPSFPSHQSFQVLDRRRQFRLNVHRYQSITTGAIQAVPFLPFRKPMLHACAKRIGRSIRWTFSHHSSSIPRRGNLDPHFALSHMIQVECPTLPSWKGLDFALDGHQRFDAKGHQIPEKPACRVATISEQKLEVQSESTYTFQHRESSLSFRISRALAGFGFQNHARLGIHHIVDHETQLSFLVRSFGVKTRVRVRFGTMRGVTELLTTKIGISRFPFGSSRAIRGRRFIARRFVVVRRFDFLVCGGIGRCERIEILFERDWRINSLETTSGGSGLDQGSIDGQDLAGNQSGLNACLHHMQHYIGKDVVRSPTFPKLDQGRPVWHRIMEIEPAKPAISSVHCDFVAEPILGDIVQIAQDEHSQCKLRIDRRAPVVFTIQRTNAVSNEREIHHGIELTQEMVLRHKLFHGNHLEHAVLRLLMAKQGPSPPVKDIQYCAVISLDNHWAFSQRF